MEEGDALLGDQKGLKVDQAMIQDSTNQQQVVEKIIRDAEAKIQAASDRATAALAAAGLIAEKSIDDVAMLMQSVRRWTWIWHGYA